MALGSRLRFKIRTRARRQVGEATTSRRPEVRALDRTRRRDHGRDDDASCARRQGKRRPLRGGPRRDAVEGRGRTRQAPQGHQVGRRVRGRAGAASRRLRPRDAQRLRARTRGASLPSFPSRDPTLTDPRSALAAPLASSLAGTHRAQQTRAPGAETEGDCARARVHRRVRRRRQRRRRRLETPRTKAQGAPPAPSPQIHPRDPRAFLLRVRSPGRARRPRPGAALARRPRRPRTREPPHVRRVVRARGYHPRAEDDGSLRGMGIGRGAGRHGARRLRGGGVGTKRRREIRTETRQGRVRQGVRAADDEEEPERVFLPP